MKRLFILLTFVLVATAWSARDVVAQDLVINNVRIIVGTGQVIEQGTILIKGGRIMSAAAGKVAAPGVRAIDGTGLTAIAGYIDAHRHIYNGRDADTWLKDTAPKNMQEFLEAGYTTLVSGGGAAEPMIALQKATDSGQIKGPHIIPSAPLALTVPAPGAGGGGGAGRAADGAAGGGAAAGGRGAGGAGRGAPPNYSADVARDSIRKMAAMGIHFTGEVNVNSFMPEPKQLEALAAAADEGKKVGVDVAVHAVSVPAMLAAVKAGVPKLVHTPHFQWMTDADAKMVKDAGVMVSSCAGFGAPVFNVFNHDNVPTFRDGGKWPDTIIDGEGRAREAGYKPVNGRTLFDDGVPYGYCTDTGYLPIWGLAQELRTLNLMFSPIDLVKVLGPNTAAWINQSKDVGTIEAGKVADINLLGGNPLGGTPLNGYWDFLNVQVTIKSGQVMVDKRAKK